MDAAILDAAVQSNGPAPTQLTAQQHDAAFEQLDNTLHQMTPPTWRNVRERAADEPATPFAELGDRGTGFAPLNQEYVATPIEGIRLSPDGIERLPTPEPAPEYSVRYRANTAENNAKPYYPPAKEYTTLQIAQMLWAFIRAKEYSDGNYDRQEWAFANPGVTDDFVLKVQDSLARNGAVQQALLDVISSYGGVAYKGET